MRKGRDDTGWCDVKWLKSQGTQQWITVLFTDFACRPIIYCSVNLKACIFYLFSDWLIDLCLSFKSKVCFGRVVFRGFFPNRKMKSYRDPEMLFCRKIRSYLCKSICKRRFYLDLIKPRLRPSLSYAYAQVRLEVYQVKEIGEPANWRTGGHRYR